MNSVKCRSSIKLQLMRTTVLRGTVSAVLGTGILLFAGLGLPVQSLSQWGWALFLLAAALIAFGMLPYRRLCRLEKQPYELIADAENLCYLRGGKLILAIPVKSIQRLSFFDEGSSYGVCLRLKKPLLEKMVLYRPRCKPKPHSFIESDLFFPYFSERSFEELRGAIL